MKSLSQSSGTVSINEVKEPVEVADNDIEDDVDIKISHCESDQ